MGTALHPLCGDIREFSVPGVVPGAAPQWVAPGGLWQRGRLPLPCVGITSLVQKTVCFCESFQRVLHYSDGPWS
jgi:hypothetical protein